METIPRKSLVGGDGDSTRIKDFGDERPVEPIYVEKVAKELVFVRRPHKISQPSIPIYWIRRRYKLSWMDMIAGFRPGKHGYREK
jgi:hypothetical protein